MLRNIRIFPRLVASFLVLVVGAVVIAAVGILGVRQVNENLREIYELRVRSISSLYEIQLAQNNATLGARSLLDPRVLSDPAARGAESDRIEAASLVLDESSKTYEAQRKDSKEETVWREARSDLDQWSQSQKALLGLLGKRLKTQDGSGLAELDQQLLEQKKRADALWTQSSERLTKALDQNVTAIGNLFQSSQRSAASMSVLQLLLAVVILAAAIGLSLVIAKSVTRPLGEATKLAEVLVATGDTSSRLASASSDEMGDLSRAIDALMDQLEAKGHEAEAIARGDLTIEVRTASEKDRLGNAFKAMLESLRTLVRAIHAGFAQVADGAQSISEASGTLSQGASDQAASLQQITSSATEIGSQANQSAENATHANALVSATRDAAEKGTVEIESMVGAMHEINQSSQQMGKIIKAIDDIAFQTNLLALNAAVEAARAGKHGKGSRWWPRRCAASPGGAPRRRVRRPRCWRAPPRTSRTGWRWPSGPPRPSRRSPAASRPPPGW